MTEVAPDSAMDLDRFRQTEQALAPAARRHAVSGDYDLYPVFPVPQDSVGVGYEAIAEVLRGHRQAMIDGYVGVLWDEFRARLDAELRGHGVTPNWIDVGQAMSSEDEIDEMLEPFLGGDDPLFGTRFTGRLRDFFSRVRFDALRDRAKAGGELIILYGCGSALADLQGPLVYVDLPKNELQFRARAGAVRNLGASTPEAPKAMYKRFYFVDWVALNRHKRDVLDRVSLFVDEQRPYEPTSIDGYTLRQALSHMSRTTFRVRPWFEPGPWGGQWIKRTIPQLPASPPNYAWSFELIVPENGLMFGDGRHQIELSFDWLMYHDHRAVLGDCAERFGCEFPIRLDFLDTVDGGNLSVQCHPRPTYIQQQFGESFTQDECYYILDCQPDAEVYLGFTADADAGEFREELERSHRETQPIEIRRFVNVEPAQKHGLYLIPSGTIHCSGAGNLVLEISATPYIFTFKMYDWLRLDLEGKPRPLNIDRAFENLRFDRRGERIAREFISAPRVIEKGPDWALVHLPTHAEHFYDVHRYEFDTIVAGRTDGSCHVMSLVEGTSIMLETGDGFRQKFSYAETFVVPAAAERYTITNQGPERAKVIKVFVKPEAT